MWRRAVAVAALGGCPLAGRATTCDAKEPYSDTDPNPWGWPLSPSDWSFGQQSCWATKYAMCGGEAQSPVNFGSCSGTQTDTPATLNSAYVTLTPTVQVSKYMRSVMVEGSNLGKLTITTDRELTATSVHVVAPAMHHMDGVSAVAEVFVVHPETDEAAGNTTHKFVITSMLIVEGNESELLASLGITADKEGEASWTGHSTDFQQIGAPDHFLSYIGSMPVPPCWETVTWLVAKAPVAASHAQVDALNKILTAATGSEHGRAIRDIGSSCDHVGNTVMPDDAAQPDSCATFVEEGTANKTSQCWAQLETCDKSPAALPPAALETTGTAWDPKDHVHYEGVEEILATVGAYTLDFTTPTSFGHLEVHGWQFVATEIKVKAISMHTLHDEIYAGEVVIVHELFGDNLTGTAHVSGPKHRVMVSIPLEIGAQSTLLQELGLDIIHYEAVRDGIGFTNRRGYFDLTEHLEPLFANEPTWYWYSGGPVLEPGAACSDWGTRWLVAGKPMTVSLLQLNTLALQVSGVDSSMATVAAPHTWAASLPDYAVDKDDSACNVSEGAETSYSYDFVNCWSKFHLPGDIENFCGGESGRSSPIDITTDHLAGTGSDDFLSRVNWKPMSGLTVDVHNHASLTVSTLHEKLGYAMLYDTTEGGFPGFYQITNVTVHMPSEHTVDGKHFAGELQVHMSKQFTDFDLSTDDALAASFFYEVGEESILMGQLLDAAHDAEHGHAMGTLDLMQTLGPTMDPANGGDFYSYSGSFTTPDVGCAPVVKWFVFTSPMSMSVAQVEEFRTLVPSPGNNRPIQDASHADIYKNSFQEGTLPKYDFYLSRTEGRDRVKKDTGMILLPVFGSVILAIAVMFATFNHQDIATKKKNSGGLMEEVLGNAAA